VRHVAGKQRAFDLPAPSSPDHDTRALWATARPSPVNMKACPRDDGHLAAQMWAPEARYGNERMYSWHYHPTRRWVAITRHSAGGLAQRAERSETRRSVRAERSETKANVQGEVERACRA
jgi:hypothetical protein